MKLRSIFQEAGANLRTGTTRAALWALVFFVVVGGVGALDALAVSALVSAANRFHAAGGSTQILSAPAGIDEAACDAIGNSTGLTGSGALALTEPISPSSLPDTPLPVYRVSPGFLKLLNIDVNGRQGVVLSEAAASVLGLTEGDTLPSTDGVIEIAGVYDYPADGRDNSLEYAAIAQSNIRLPFDQCWIRSAATGPPPAGLSRSVLIADPVVGVEVTTRQLNASLGETFDGKRAFDERPSRWAPIAGLLAGFAIGFTSIRVRRLEAASAQQAGVSRQAQGFQFLTEIAAWVSLGAVLTMPFGGIILDSASMSGDESTIVVGLALTVATGMVGSIAGGLVALISIRPGQIYNYFRER